MEKQLRLNLTPELIRETSYHVAGAYQLALNGHFNQQALDALDMAIAKLTGKLRFSQVDYKQNSVNIDLLRGWLLDALCRLEERGLSREPHPTSAGSALDFLYRVHFQVAQA